MSAWAGHNALLAEQLHERKLATIRMAMVDRGVPCDEQTLDAVFYSAAMERRGYPDGTEVYFLLGVPLVGLGPLTHGLTEDGLPIAYQALTIYLR